jgi:hypothetical protein
VGSPSIVEGQVPADRGSGLADCVVGPEVDLLVLDRPPEPLNEDVVASGAPSIHADGNAGLEQHAREVVAGELRALIDVEDLGPAVPGKRLLRVGALDRP